jgi:leucine dehydrogenase
VGYRLAELIRQAGGEIWVSDLAPEVVRRAQEKLGAHPVSGEEIFDLRCDVFAPCALGAVLNEKTIPRLRCQAVVGAANNQLATEMDGIRLHERGILYAPDFAANAGGIINIFVEHEGYHRDKAMAKASAIYDTMKEIYRRADLAGKPPVVVADQLAEERLYGKA